MLNPNKRLFLFAVLAFLIVPGCSTQSHNSPGRFTERGDLGHSTSVRGEVAFPTIDLATQRWISPDGCKCQDGADECPPELYQCINQDYECFEVDEKCMNDGKSPTRPWREWKHALESLQPGDTLIAMDGTWNNASAEQCLDNPYMNTEQCCAPDDPRPCQAGAKLPKVYCKETEDDTNPKTEWGEFSNGEANAPITIRAENERRAFLHSNGSDYALAIQNCKYWNVEGLRGRTGDLSGDCKPDSDDLLKFCWEPSGQVQCTEAPCGSENSVFDFHSSENIVVRRNLGSHNNRYLNTHIFSADYTKNSLFEENEAYFHSRHGFSFTHAEGVTARRNYSHSRSYADLQFGRESHDAAPDMGDESLVLYFAKNSIAENNIGEYSEGMQATGTDNKILGSAMLDAVYSFRILSNCVDDVGAAQNCTEEKIPYAMDNLGQDLISLRTQTMRIDACPFADHSCGYRIPIAFNCESSINCRYRHTSAFDSRNYSFLGRDTLDLENYGNSFEITNSLSVGSRLNGFRKEDKWGGDPPTNTYETTEWSGDLLVAWDWKVGQSGFKMDEGDDPNSWGEHYELDPELGACKIQIPESSPMWTWSDGALGRIGAEMLYRYEDGVLTSAPLWDPITGEFPCGTIVSGLNDVPGRSCFDVHERLGVDSPECPFPEGYGSAIGWTATPRFRTSSTDAVFEFEAHPDVLDVVCDLDGLPTECEFDASAHTGSLMVAGLSEGLHRVEVQATSGSEGEARGRSYRWTVDHTPPESIDRIRILGPTVLEVTIDEPLADAPTKTSLGLCPAGSENECADDQFINAEPKHLRIDRGRRFQIDLVQPLAAGDYELTIDGAWLTDISGNNAEESKLSMSFVVGPAP